MTLAHLRRIDCHLNMARFYQIDIAPNLFGEVSVLRSWGRIGTRGRQLIETCPTQQDAATAAAKTIKRKLRRGYLSAEDV